MKLKINPICSLMATGWPFLHENEGNMASATGDILMNEALTASKTSEKFNLETNSDKFIATIDATAVNAATTVAGKVQHSHNGTDWFDLTSFTNIVGVEGHEAKQITDSVLPYVRAVITLSGATQAATIKVMLWFDKRGK